MEDRITLAARIRAAIVEKSSTPKKRRSKDNEEA